MSDQHWIVDGAEVTESEARRLVALKLKHGRQDAAMAALITAAAQPKNAWLVTEADEMLLRSLFITSH